MARFRGGGLKWQNIFVIILFIVVGLYLFGTFSKPTDEGREFAVPTDVDSVVMTVFRIIVIGAFTFGAYALFMKLSNKSLTSRDAFSLILIGVGIILLWTILAPILNAPGIDQITFSVGQKMGFFSP